MKKLLITVFVVMAMVCMLAVSVSAAAPLPQKPDIGVNFGTVSTIDGFTAPSELFVNTDERVLLDLGEGNYVTYPTYYVTKNSTTFDVDFSKLNSALGGKSYSKANIALLEIPEGITTIKDSTFSGTGYTVCKYVQFPSTITTFGNGVFNTNKAVKIVEFKDGTTPLTIGDTMFGGNWAGGTVVEYVKFPNNAVSIGNNTFGKTTTNKTVILGKNLESIGTGFFTESTPETTNTFVYFSSKFFSETEMFTNLFGEHTQYHNKHMMLTLFYTGTEEQAKDFVAAGKEIQTGYIWDDNKVTYVSASEYDYETHRPKAKGNITMVYDYNACDAFYNGVHDIKVEGENKCCGVCANCGITEMLENPTHTYEWIFNDGKGVSFMSTITAESACKFCKTENPDEEAVAIEAILSSKGISYDENDGTGVYEEIKVNKEALLAYVAITGQEFDYGIFAAVATEDKGTPLTIGEDGKIVADDKTVFATFADTDYMYLKIKVTGLDNGSSIFCGAYLQIGDNLVYVSNKEEGATVNKFTAVLPETQA